MRTLFFAAVLLSQAAFAENVVVTPADNGKTFTLAVDQCLDVRLSTQAASTGYDWHLAPVSTPLMQIVRQHVTAADSGLIGAPAQLDIVLCAATPGRGAVKLIYNRVWEHNTPPAQALSFAVTITP
jgi:predicted secreted protein